MLYEDERLNCFLEEIVELDWETQILTVSDSGDVIGTAGSMVDLFGAADLATPDCAARLPRPVSTRHQYET